MSESIDRTPEKDAPPAEGWLKVMLVAFVPGVAALFTPKAWTVPLLGVSVALLAVAVVMLVRHAPPGQHRRR